MAQRWWILLLRGVLGQGYIPQVPRPVPARAGVINDSPTAGPWVIFELRLFFNVECTPESQLRPFFTETWADVEAAGRWGSPQQGPVAIRWIVNGFENIII